MSKIIANTNWREITMVMYSELRLGTSGADTIIATDEVTLILALDGDDIIVAAQGMTALRGR